MLQIFLASHNMAKRETLQHYKQHCLCLGLNAQTGYAVRTHTNPFGKPYLSDFPDWQFNFSHSKRHASLVLGQVPFALGIDIESYPRTIRPELAQASLSPQEWHVYQHHPDPMRYWLQVWTIKEAILKAAGTGIHFDMNNLNTQLHTNQHHGQVQLHHQAYAYQCWAQSAYQLCVAWPRLATLPDLRFVYSHLD